MDTIFCLDLAIMQAEFTSKLDDVADMHKVPRKIARKMVLETFERVFKDLEQEETT